MLRNRRGLLFGLLLILGPAVAAAPWTLVESPLAEARADFRIERYSEAGADGFWAVGFVQSEPTAIKFDLAGNPIARAADDRFSTSPASPKRLADGGVLLPGTRVESSQGCVLTRLAADGRVIWQTDLDPDGGDSQAICGSIEQDAAGNIWVGLRASGFARVARLTPDGNLVAMIDASGQFGLATQMVADPVGAGVYLAGHRLEDVAGSVHARAQVVRYRADGTVHWSWQTGNASVGTSTRLLQVSAPHGILALHTPTTEANSPEPSADWVAVALQASGALRFERNLAFTRPVSIAQMSALDTQGAWLTIADPETATTPTQVSVQRLGLNGGLGTSHVIDNAVACSIPGCRGGLRSDGGLWTFVISSSDLSRLLVGLDANGVERARAQARSGVFSLLPDGRAQSFSFPEGPRRIGFDQAPQLVPATAALVPDRLRLRNEAAADDGGSVQLFDRPDDDGFRLRYKPTLAATAAWQLNWNGLLASSPQVSISETLVCLATRFSEHTTEQVIVACWRRSDGSLFWESSADFDFINDHFSIRALPDGGVATLAVESSRFAIYQRIDGAGQARVGALVPEFTGVSLGSSIGPTGDAVLVAFEGAGGGATMYRIDRDGNLRFRIPVPSESTSTFPRFAPDGSVLLFAGSAARYSADGQFLWRTGLLAQVWDAVTGDDTVWISLMRSAARPADDLVALDLATGALRWSHDLHGQSNERPQVELGAGNRLMVLQGQRSYLRWRVYDGADGTLRHEQTDGCGAVLCDLILLRRDGNGVARAWLDTFSASDGWGATLMQLPDAVADVPRIAADQDGVSGAWFAPWSNGQGLVIDWIAGARTLFAPWFTFSPSDPSDFFEYRTTADSVTADLHWFTLQGVVAPGATRADLALLSTDGGDFGVGIANAHQVGDASLEFESCDRAHLRYRFDPEVNDGAEGLITLTRLTPGVACATTTTTATVPTPSKRFDASFEGSWFDPASSGQGLMFTAIPAADTLFATWFTYDPAAAPDETTEQHWFTLQGPLGDGDQTTLAIVRTQGGSFDELPTTNAQQVGTAIVTRLGCDRAELRYQFDDNDIAASFRGLGGSQILSRIGGCE